jgi:hypothetical protein
MSSRTTLRELPWKPVEQACALRGKRLQIEIKRKARGGPIKNLYLRNVGTGQCRIKVFNQLKWG